MRTPSLVVALAVLAAPVVASGAPLRDLPLVALQPDGTPVTLFATGDEHHRRVFDAEGFTVVRDPVTGWLVYGDRVGADLAPTGLAVGTVDPRIAGLAPGMDEDLLALEARVQPVRIARQAWPATPTKGVLTNVVIFVRFAGDDELTERIEDYDREFNDVTPGATSLRAFYHEVSRGTLDLPTIFVPPPDDQGWAVAYTDPNERGYYSMYHAAANPKGYRNDSEAEQREHALLKAALAAVEAQIPADVDLDADDDGLVDNVIFMIQGWPDQWSNLLWPHMWQMFEDTPFRGAKVLTYNVQFTTMMVLSTGTFAHEMAHSLGAPDLYHYNQDNLTPVGPWDLMEATSSPPQHMLSYLKWKYLGWVDAAPEAQPGAPIRLYPSWDKGPQAMRVTTDASASQGFWLEYRRAEGPFEASLPGSGLLVYRVDEGVAGDGNRSGPPDEVYVFRPGGAPGVRGSVGKAPLGAFTGRDRMNEYTDPAPALQDGTAVTLRVYDVVEDADGVTFRVCLARPDCGLRACGDDGCGGLCGLCAGQTHCVDGGCVPCTCEGLECGDDGCGTACGSCDDGNACTTDTCEAGTCRHADATAGTACDDGNACTSGDACDGAGACAGAAYACEEEPCRSAACDGTGGCLREPLPDTTACDDDDPCTSNDRCDGKGTCGGAAYTCEAEPCRSAACDGTGGCLREPLPAATACDDGEPCTADDRCDGKGACVGTPACVPDNGPGSDLPAADLPPGDLGGTDAAPDAGKKGGGGGCAAGGGPTGVAGAMMLLAFLGIARSQRRRSGSASTRS